MLKNDNIFLEHILESINLIQTHVKGLKFSDFADSWPLLDASIHRIEVIGEAANKVSDSFKKKHKDIPWKDIVGMRNFLIHEYFNVDDKEVWRTIKKDLPYLKKMIKNILK